MSASRKYTPPELARLWRVGPSKILAWIHSGELPAINAATTLASKRPRFLIDQEAVDQFERRRAVRPVARQRRRTKSDAGATQYF